jgi:hypothetical protein
MDNLLTCFPGPQFSGVALVNLTFGTYPLLLRGAVTNNLCTHDTSITGSLVQPYEIYTHMNVTSLALTLDRQLDGLTYNYVGVATGSANFLGVNVSVLMQFTDSTLTHFGTVFSYSTPVLTAISDLQFSTICNVSIAPLASGSGNITIQTLFNVDIALDATMEYYGTNCLSGSLWTIDAAGTVAGLIVYGMALNANVQVTVQGALYVLIGVS